MGIKEELIKLAIPIIVDKAGDKLKNMSADDIIGMLRDSVPGQNGMYNGGMYGGNYMRNGGLYLPEGLKEAVNGTAPKTTNKRGAKSAASAPPAAPPATQGDVAPPGNLPPDGDSTTGNPAKPFDPKDYSPSPAQTGLWTFGVPVLGDAVGAIGNAYGISQGMFGQMLNIMANNMNKQSQYSNLVPDTYAAGANIAAGVPTAKGAIGSMVGNTINNRLQEISNTKWAQAMSDANRRFYVEHQPNIGQQEYDARLLTTANKKTDRSTAVKNNVPSDENVKSTRPSDTMLRRPGRDDDDDTLGLDLKDMADTGYSRSRSRAHSLRRLRKDPLGGANDTSRT